MRGSTAAIAGSPPAVACAGVCPQPEITLALQREPSITATVSDGGNWFSSPCSGAYTVFVASSTVGHTAPGLVATCAGAAAQPAVCERLQPRMSITDTNPSPLPT